MTLNLEQLRKRAKDLVRSRRADGRTMQLADAQFEIARELGFASWPKLKAYIERLGAEHAFRTDAEYYEGRAAGIAGTNGTTLDEARAELARRHGFGSWHRLMRHVSALDQSFDPFVAAYRAVEGRDLPGLTALLDEYPELVAVHGTNGNDLLGMSANVGDLHFVRVLLEHGAEVNRGNDYGWTPLHQAGYSNNVELANLLLEAGADPTISARGDGGTPLIVSLFWGHREVAAVLGDAPGNLRVAAGLGRLDMIRSLAGTPAAGAHRGFYRPHGTFPAWEPTDDPQEVLDEALSWAARSDRDDAAALLIALGARVNADVYRGTALAWAAFNGHANTIQRLLGLGADPNRRATFGGPSHGQGVTALHLAAQNARTDAVDALLRGGADPSITDDLYGGTAAGWAEHEGHPDLAQRLRS